MLHGQHLSLDRAAGGGQCGCDVERDPKTRARQLQILEHRVSKEKLVAQLDCDSYPDAVKAVLDKIAPVEGAVQTNLRAAVRPEKG